MTIFEISITKFKVLLEKVLQSSDIPAKRNQFLMQLTVKEFLLVRIKDYDLFYYSKSQ